MANLTQQIIDFAMSLPPSTNPYEATAALIKKETDVNTVAVTLDFSMSLQLTILPDQTAKPALWAVILRRIIAVQYLMRVLYTSMIKIKMKTQINVVGFILCCPFLCKVWLVKLSLLFGCVKSQINCIFLGVTNVSKLRQSNRKNLSIREK
jgi:hypothetical protein